MRHNPAHATTDPEAVRDLIRQNPWATIVSDNAGELIASHYPVLLDENAEGLALLTHVGRPDEELHGFGAREVLVIVQGRHGYVSPSWYGPDATRAPTWNFSVAHCHGVPEVLGAGGEALASSSADLENSAEPARSPAAAADLGPRAAPRRRILRGTVTSVGGAPVARARVTLQRSGSPAADDCAESDEHGDFLLRYTGPGDFEIVARAKDLGVTVPRVLQLPDDSSTLGELELLIAEPDALAGVLEDFEGHALRDVDLWAFPAHLAQAESGALFEWRGSARARTLRGETSGFSRTDGSGRFRFEGLAPGSYFIARTSDLDVPHDPRLFFTTGATAIRLVYEGDCWLELGCRDESGAEVRGARVICAPLVVDGPSDLLLEPSSARAAEDGAIVFQVEPCRVYRCGFFDPLRGLVEEEIHVPCRGGTSRRVLVLPQASGSGTLVLDFPELSGLSVERPRRVRVRSAASGVLLQSWTQVGWSRTRLPQGTYVLEVAEPPARGPEGFVRGDPLGELPVARREFSIQDALDTRIELR